MPIYTLNLKDGDCCTIEVAKGRRSAKAKRHSTGESVEFEVIAVDGAPTPEVQAQRWALGMPKWEPPVVEVAAEPEVEPTPLVLPMPPADAATDAPADTELDEPPDDESDHHNHPAIAKDGDNNG